MNIFKTHTNAPLPTGIFTMGDNIITVSKLIFMGVPSADYFRAFDEESDKELWRGQAGRALAGTGLVDVARARQALLNLMPDTSRRAEAGGFRVSDDG